MIFEMREISRRTFLQVAGTAILAAAALPALGGAKARHGEKRVRIRPVSGADLRPGEIAFYRRARFATAADAMRAAAARRMNGAVYVEQ